MSLFINNKKDNKKGGKGAKSSVPGAKTAVKPGKSAAVSKKPVKTGGARGS
jgi:hypothetical protein